MKFIKILLLSLLLYSCDSGKWENLKPIEKYQNKGFVVIEEPIHKVDAFNYSIVRLKSKDSIFLVYVPSFDGLNLKIGDTLKSK